MVVSCYSYKKYQVRFEARSEAVPKYQQRDLAPPLEDPAQPAQELFGFGCRRRRCAKRIHELPNFMPLALDLFCRLLRQLIVEL